MQSLSPTVIAAHAAFARAGIRSDDITAASIAALFDAQIVHLCDKASNPLPPINHSDAEIIGEALHNAWPSLVGKGIPARSDLAWADIVQFVARHIRSAECENATLDFIS